VPASDAVIAQEAPDVPLSSTRELNAVVDAGADRLPLLDAVRGICALGVLAGHARGFCFKPFTQLPTATLFDSIFYFMTGFGHQAVIVFFVLSGYFVGGSAWKRLREGTFTWKAYGQQRLVRLWIVLLPALVLTIGWDTIGQALSHGRGYDGTYAELFHSGPSAAKPHDLTFKTFLLNCVFLQTIVGPVFGTNGPVWSLANEFWYYVLFPLLALLVMPRTRSLSRLVSGVIALVALFLLPGGLLIGGIYWLLGWVCYLALHSATARRFMVNMPMLLVGGVCLVTALVASRSQSVFGSDTVIAIAFALILPSLASGSIRNKTLSAIATVSGNTSYTLYLVHFPVLAALFFYLSPAVQNVPSLFGYLRYALILLVVLLYGLGIWWMFERNTATVRRWIVARFR
jgi:peptidoglycan/LPS O-acetylase OafA/YrhL